MNINENELIKLISRILIEMNIDNTKLDKTISKKDLYVILSDKWEEEYLTFFNMHINKSNYNIHTVIPGAMMNLFIEKNIPNVGELISRENIDIEGIDGFTTVFPILSRDIIAKAALCISDVFETKWIENCIAKGLKVIVRKSGLKAFSGLESRAYVNKIMGYYEDLKSYGIEITDDLLSFHGSDIEKDEEVKPIPLSSKKVITEKDIDSSFKDKTIVLNPGDIMTSLAKEKAKNQGINIIISK